MDLPEFFQCPFCGGTGLSKPWAHEWPLDRPLDCEWCRGVGLVFRSDPEGVMAEWADRMRDRRWSREADI